jgi:hypothetical protein
MSSIMYEFVCPLCGTPIEATESVGLDETHEPNRTLVKVRIHDGARLIHECQAAPQSRSTSAAGH